MKDSAAGEAASFSVQAGEEVVFIRLFYPKDLTFLKKFFNFATSN